VRFEEAGECATEGEAPKFGRQKIDFRPMSMGRFPGDLRDDCWNIGCALWTNRSLSSEGLTASPTNSMPNRILGVHGGLGTQCFDVRMPCSELSRQLQRARRRRRSPVVFVHRFQSGEHGSEGRALEIPNAVTVIRKMLPQRSPMRLSNNRSAMSALGKGPESS